MITFDLSFTTLKFVIPLLALVDIFLTWKNTQLYKKIFPDKDWTAHEVNPLVRGAWKKFGLNKGTLLASIFTLGLIAILIFFFAEEYLLVILAAYIPIIAIHVRNLVFISREGKKKLKDGILLVVLFGILFLANAYYVITNFRWITFGITFLMCVALVYSIRKCEGEK